MVAREVPGSVIKLGVGITKGVQRDVSSVSVEDTEETLRRHFTVGRTSGSVSSLVVFISVDLETVVVLVTCSQQKLVDFPTKVEDGLRIVSEGALTVI